MPCFNEAGHLRAASEAVIETLERQGRSCEIIFVDDASATTRARILREICDAEPRCRLIACTVNGGRGAAFKRGFAAARGSIVGFIDIDLEIGAHYIPPLIERITRTAPTWPSARRTNELRQHGGLHRARRDLEPTRSYSSCSRLGRRDTETGCKFFKR